jgi:hypothetical protein
MSRGTTGRRVAAAGTGAALLLAMSSAACRPAAPDRLETDYVDLAVEDPTTLTLPQGEASVWADSGSAEAVTCWAAGPGDAPRTELRGHSRDLRVSVPVTREGREFVTVGKLPPGPGEVTVECTGPAQALLHAAISRSPA